MEKSQAQISPNIIASGKAGKVRVQKFISASGVASRRKAEDFIRSGQVSINGRKAKLGDTVDPNKDEIKVYGKIVKNKNKLIYIALNKPKGYVVSKRDPQGRRTIFSLLPEDFRHQVWNVGRLDFDTEGLIILTNDGQLTQDLSHPKYEHDKEYEVVTDSEPRASQIEKLREGVEIATGKTSPAKLKIKSGLVYLTIHEGKKRQVRRMFNSLGIGIKNLRRVRISKLKLSPDLPPGKFKLIEKSDIL